MANFKTSKTRIAENLWLPIVFAILALGLSVVFAEVQNQIGWRSLFAACMICLISFFLAITVLIRNVYPVSVDILEKLKSQVDRYVDKGALNWIMTSKQLADFEQSTDAKEIWLVSSDLAEDIPGGQFFTVVEANLKRGIRYRYFIPKALETQARARQLLACLGSSGDFKFRYLSDDFFFLVPHFDIAIYDPMNKTGKRCGYMGLPVQSGHRLHGQMDGQFVDVIIGKLQSLFTKP